MLATKLDHGRPSVAPARAREWLDFAAHHPDATVTHHPAWMDLLSSTYRFTSGVFTLKSSNGQVVAGLPFMRVHSRLTGSRVVALPFTDHSPPLAAPGWDLEMSQAVHEWAAADLPVEVHARLPADDHELVSAGVRHLLRLDDFDVLQKGLAKTATGRALRKGERSGLSTTVEHSLDAVRAFYRLHSLTRRRQGVPIQPWRFFRLLHQNLIAAGLGMVVMAHLDRTPVAGAVFLSWNSTLIYKFGASDPAYWDLRPNNLVMWRAIRWGCSHDCRILDFGKTDADNEGLRRFKSGWGAEEVALSHTHLPAGAGTARSPLALSASSSLIRRSPVIAARIIGELFYGHFA